MRRTVQTQWNFSQTAEASADPQAGRRILSVTELTVSIRRALEQQFGRLWVTGEVTNLRLQGSGHIYFSLKDANAQVSCVLFRGEPVAHRALLQDGKKVNLMGELTVYEPRGQYQLRVQGIELQGLGALQQEFERLKQKLKDEGLFDPGRKRPIPRYPQRIGIVTSPTGAALRDVLHVIQRRQPGLEILLAPSRVQGQGAGVEIAESIRLLNGYSENHPDQRLDLILITRGGGSLEDLWAFNEEVLARAIAASSLPVVSAVGHEIDFTISDFVADLRAATPSAAAELITEGAFSSCRFVQEAAGRMARCVRARFEDRRWELQQWSQRMARMHPRRRLEDQLQRLDDLQAGLLRCLQVHQRHIQVMMQNVVQRLGRVRPSVTLLRQLQAFEKLYLRFAEKNIVRLRALQQRALLAQDRLRLLSPRQVLERGYSITVDASTGKIVRAAGDVQPGGTIRTQLSSGSIESKVTRTLPDAR